MKCKVCGSSNVVLNKNGNTSLFFCRDCTFSFNANIQSDQKIDKYYKNVYRQSENDYVRLEKRRINLIPEQIKLLHHLAEVKPPPANILDIGCANGFFLDEMRRYGYKTTGIEPSEWCRNYCSNLGIEVKTTINEIDGELFDIITLWHVLEHVPEPTRYMKGIYNFLKDDGVIALRVPDYGSFCSRMLKDKWVWFQPQNHLSHFTKQSLITLFIIAGFEIVVAESRNTDDRFNKSANKLANAIYSRYFKDKTYTFFKFVKSILSNLKHLNYLKAKDKLTSLLKTALFNEHIELYILVKKK